MRTILMMAVLATGGPPGAQTPMPKAAPMPMPVPACTAAAPLPPALAGWDRPVAIGDGGALVAGRGAMLTLAANARFATPPGHTPAAGTFGATARFDVAVAGTYRVALGSGVWIDIVHDGKMVTSVAHGHGPACGPVRKTVDFALPPGRYTLQVSGSTTPTVQVMLAKAG